jgi:hypothetical protein
MFVAVEGYELETLRRSLAMLPPQATGLTREEALRLLTELQDLDRRLRELRTGLIALVEIASNEKP